MSRASPSPASRAPPPPTPPPPPSSSTPPQPPVRIAIVGTGLIGPRHAQSVVRSGTATLACVVDPDPAAQRVADAFNVPLYTSTAQMLRGGDGDGDDDEVNVDAAIVCTPNAFHASVSRELLAAGVHVLVEKPISSDVGSARALVDFANRPLPPHLVGHRPRLLVGHHRRFNPHVAAARNALLAGAVGRPVAVSAIWALYKPPSYFRPPTHWRASARDGGGVVLINLVHEVDVLQFLLGPIVRVHAEQTPGQRGHGHAAEEGAAILLRFASGVVGAFVLSDATPSPHNFEAGTGENPLIPRAGRDFYRILGTDGTLSVGDMRLTRHADGLDKSWSSPLTDIDVPVGREVPFDEQVAHLVRVVRAEEEPCCTGEDGLSALIVCDAVRKILDGGGGMLDIVQDRARL